MIIVTPTGAPRTVTPGRPWHDPPWYWTGTENAETLAQYGYIVQPDPPPVVPILDELRAAALVGYRASATEAIRTGVPAPWDTLRELATPEFRDWVDAFLALVAAELSRVEDAAAAATTPAELAAIVPDWPEVE